MCEPATIAIGFDGCRRGRCCYVCLWFDPAGTGAIGRRGSESPAGQQQRRHGAERGEGRAGCGATLQSSRPPTRPPGCCRNSVSPWPRTASMSTRVRPSIFRRTRQEYGQLDQLTVHSNALREAAGYQQQGMNYQTQAGIDEASSKNAATAGYLGRRQQLAFRGRSGCFKLVRLQLWHAPPDPKRLGEHNGHCPDNHQGKRLTVARLPSFPKMRNTPRTLSAPASVRRSASSAAPPSRLRPMA